MKPIVLVGGGGHCKSVIEAIESIRREIHGILDPNEPIGSTILGYSVLGGDHLISELAKEVDFVITVGAIKDFSLRVKLHDKVLNANGTLATIIASTAYVSKHSLLGKGTVVLHNAVVNAGANIGKGCIINTLANIEHDAIVGDYSHVSTGTMVNGNCIVGKEVMLGSQSVLMNGISIVDNTIVAAGSFVRKSILQSGIYAGNPAILMKKM